MTQSPELYDIDDCTEYLNEMGNLGLAGADS